MKTVKFVNFSNELFAHPSLGGRDEQCKWNNEPYEFPAKSSCNMEDWKADHFAKHLVNRELEKEKKYSQMSPSKPEEAGEYMALYKQAVIEIGTADLSEEKAKDAVLNANPIVETSEKEAKKSFCDKCDSKGVSHKKGCPNRPIKKEESFEGLELK